jgi:hypothetical protein
LIAVVVVVVVVAGVVVTPGVPVVTALVLVVVVTDEEHWSPKFIPLHPCLAQHSHKLENRYVLGFASMFGSVTVLYVQWVLLAPGCQ